MGRRRTGIDMSARFLECCDDVNCSTYSRLFAQYSNLALKRFEWHNLPEGIEGKHIEEALYKQGQCFFTKDKLQSNMLICLPCSDQGYYNIYGEPTKVLLVGNGYSQTYDMNKGIRILDNWMLYPLVRHIQNYVTRLSELEFAINRNLQQQNYPYIFSCNKDTEFTMKNIFNKIKRKEEAIYYDKAFNDGDGIGIETTDISKPYIVDKLRQEYYELEKELLTILGLNCIMNKEGGMSITELNSNNMLIDMYLEDGLKNRQKAAEEINKKFGLNIEVVSTAREMEKLFMEQQEQNEIKEMDRGEEDV